MLDSSIWNFLHPAHYLAHGSSPSVYAKLVTLARNQRVKSRWTAGYLPLASPMKLVRCWKDCSLWKLSELSPQKWIDWAGELGNPHDLTEKLWGPFGALNGQALGARQAYIVGWSIPGFGFQLCHLLTTVNLGVTKSLCVLITTYKA